MIVECFLLYNVKKMLSKCICWEPRVIVILFFFILFLVSKVSAIVILYTIIIIHLPLFGFFFYNKCFFAICEKSFFILSFGFFLLTNYWKTLTGFKLIIFFSEESLPFSALLVWCVWYQVTTEGDQMKLRYWFQTWPTKLAIIRYIFKISKQKNLKVKFMNDFFF